MENKDKNLAWAGKNHNKKRKGGVTKTEKRCVLPQITIDKLQHVLAQKWDVCRHKSQVTKLKDVLPQITRDIFFLWKDKNKILVWADTITRNKGQGVLAQITKDNFFLWKDKDKNLLWAGTNHN